MQELCAEGLNKVIIAEEYGLKDLNEAELFKTILDAGAEWGAAEWQLVTDAYLLGSSVHQDDTHRELPYTYHLLRNTARIVSYLHISDPEILAGSLLHDSVEDHPDEVARFELGELAASAEIVISDDPFIKQQLALERIAVLFTPRVAAMVAGMSNPPHTAGEDPSYADRLQQYVDHVAVAIEQPDVWLGKLCDWADNGLGIVHSNFGPNSKREKHFQLKYGMVEPVLEARFMQPDIQAMLNPVARVNVQHMFDLAQQRLRIGGEPNSIGAVVVNN